MLRIVNIIELVAAVMLIVSIVMQNKGAGLSSAFGGDMGGYYTKRGMEKFLVWFSVFLSFIFLASAVVHLILSSRLP